jgi:hypothetical protein
MNSEISCENQLIVDRHIGVQAAERYLEEKEMQRLKDRKRVALQSLGFAAFTFGAGALLVYSKKNTSKNN